MTSQGGFHPNIKDKRVLEMLFASEVVDVHGNWVRYDYDSQKRLSRIHSNDGREIKLFYQGASAYISSASANGRTWQYEYETESLNDHFMNHIFDRKILKRVIQPDGLMWDFNLAGMFDRPGPGDRCGNSISTTLEVTHPNGTQGTFELNVMKHRQGWAFWETYTSLRCQANFSLPSRNTTFHDLYHEPLKTMSVVSKTLSGIGMSDRVWTYEYESDVDEQRYPAGHQYEGHPISTSENDPTNWTKITAPDGVESTYYHFWTADDGPYDYPDGMLDRIEVRDGATGALVEKQEYSYEIATGYGNSYLPFHPSPATLYNDISAHRRITSDSENTVRTKTITYRDGDTYTTELSYNLDLTSPSFSFQRPTLIRSYSSMSADSREVAFSYEHNKTKWILGLPKTRHVNGHFEWENFYNPLGLLKSRTLYSQSNFATYAYNADGTLNQVQDALNREVLLLNWKNGRPQEVRRAAGSSIETVEHLTVDDNGWVTSVTDPRNNTTVYTHDPMGRLESIDPPGAFYNSTTIDYDFPDTGGAVQTVTRGDAVTTITYDGMLRPVEERSVALDSGWTSVVETQYDAMERTVFVSNPYDPAAGTDVRGARTRYDALGRVERSWTSRADGTGSWFVTNTSYHAGNMTRTTDPANHVTETYRDGLDGPGAGNVLRIHEALRDTTMSYDGLGNLLTLTQTSTVPGHARSVTQTFGYDVNNRMCRHYAPEHGETRYEHDNAGQMTSYAKGQRQTYGAGCASSLTDAGLSNHKVDLRYDALGRLARKYYADPDTPDHRYYYDANGNREWAIREFQGVANSRTSHVRLAFDEMNNLAYERHFIKDAPREYIVRYTYDANGHLNYRRTPDNNHYVWDNDAFGHQQDLRQGTYAYASNILYHPDGSLKGFSYGNGTLYTRLVDNYSRTRRIQHKKYGLFTPLDLTYEYDDRSLIEDIEDRSTPAIGSAGKTHDVSSIQYDALGQMVRADGWWGTGEYAYDGLGNLHTKTLGAGTTSPRTVTNLYTNHNLMSWSVDSLFLGHGGKGNRSFGYDGRGNMTRMTTNGGAPGGRIMYPEYDLADEMVGMSGVNPWGGSVAASYAYNADGKRVQSIVDGRTTYSVYDQAGRMVLADKVSDGETVERLYLEAGEPLAKWTGTVLTYLHADHLGTPRRGTHGLGTQDDTSGNPASPGAEVFADFSTPFGMSPTPAWHGNAGSGFDPATGPGSNCGVTGFTTHVRDCQTGLEYMQARYYDSVSARFTSNDPVTFLDTQDPRFFNRYSYTFNDPVNLTDPNGENPLKDVWDAVTQPPYERANLTGTNTVITRDESGAITGGGTVPVENLSQDTTEGIAMVGTALAVSAGSVAPNVRAVSNPTPAASRSVTATTPAVPAATPVAGSSGGPGAGANFSTATQDAARAASGNRCVFCQQPTIRSQTPAPNRSNIDHAIPKVRGGNNTAGNAQNTCQTCNLRKGTRTTEEFLRDGS
ncbi:MAG: RHS repeat-associated core domain-containing protein [Litorimonas sp.]